MIDRKSPDLVDPHILALAERPTKDDVDKNCIVPTEVIVCSDTDPWKHLSSFDD